MGSYERYVWLLVLCREEEGLKAAQWRLEQEEASASSNAKEGETCKQRVEDAIACVLQSGAEREPKMYELPPNRHGHGRNRHQQQISDPFKNYYEFEPMDFDKAFGQRSSPHYYANSNLALSEHEKKHVQDLLSAVARDDMDDVLATIAKTSVVVRDGMSVTPLFLGVYAGKTETVKLLFKTAKKQFDAFKQKKIEEAKEAEDRQQEEDEEETDLKGQIRRINNLDLSTGEGSLRGKPTPDQMRRQLEAAETAAVDQLAALKISSDVKSPVAPEVLLLVRSPVLPAEEKRLLELKTKLAETQPCSFSEGWKQHPTQLSPLELAVIRQDHTMISALIELVSSCVAFRSEEGDEDEQHDPEEKGAIDDGDSSGEDEDNSDEDYYEEEYQQDKSSVLTAFSERELRYLLCGGGSRIPDLNNMTLIELAIATDDVEVFGVVASYAREFVLPRGAIAAWKCQENSGGDNSAMDDSLEMKQSKENEIIAGTSSSQPYQYNNWKLPLFAPRSSTSPGSTVHMYLTPLQFALSVGAEKVATTIMEGECDKFLVDWILEEASTIDTEKASEIIDRTTKKRGNITDIDAVTVAYNWLMIHLAEKDKSLARALLGFHLVQPTAPDSVGRSALYFAPVDLVDAVIGAAEAANQALTGTSGGDEDGSVRFRTAFLEGRSSKVDATPLMAAAGAHQGDKVKKLISVGCRRSASAGPNNWNSVHVSLPASASPAAEEWKACEATIDILLEGATDNDIEQCLLSESAEHTPLMLAASTYFSNDAVSYLLRKMAKVVTQGLARRDMDLNSTLHLAVNVVQENAANINAAPEKLEATFQAVAALLEQPDLPTVAGPYAENARGSTAVEQVLQAVVLLWQRNSMQVLCSTHLRNRQRQQQGGGAHDSQAASSDEEHIARKTLNLLDETAKQSSRQLLRRRLPVSFDEAAKAASYRLAQGQKEEIKQQIIPTGPPVVLSLDNNNSPRPRHGQHHQQLQQWNGWHYFR